MDFNTILTKMITKDPESPLAVLFGTLTKPQIAILLRKLKALLEAKKEELRAKILDLLQEVLVPRVLQSIRNKAWNLARSTTGGYVLFTYLPIFIIALAILLVLYFYKKINGIQALMLFLIVTFILFFFTVVLFAVAYGTVNNLFKLEVLARQLEEIILAIRGDEYDTPVDPKDTKKE